MKGRKRQEGERVKEERGRRINMDEKEKEEIYLLLLFLYYFLSICFNNTESGITIYMPETRQVKFEVSHEENSRVSEEKYKHRHKDTGVEQ